MPLKELLPNQAEPAEKPRKTANQSTITGFPFADRAQPPHLAAQSYHSNHLDQLPPSLPDPKPLSNFLHSLETQDFQATLLSFNRLSAHQKSRLSTHVYDSLFSLAARILEEDKFMPDVHQDDGPRSLSIIDSGTQQQPYTIDYCKIQQRLVRVDQLFQSIQRALSTEQLHLYLQNTILSAALSLRRAYQSSSKNQPTDEHSKELFLQSRQHISSIIQRLPALSQIPIPSADQLAQAIPFETLGLYARFLVVFHQPNQGLKLMRKVYYGYLIGRRRKMLIKEECPEASDDEGLRSAIETGSLIISLLRQKIHHRLAALKLAVRMITIGGLYPDQFHLASLLRRMYMSKPEWDSTLEFLAHLPDRSASRWLETRVAIVEAEDGRVERVLHLSSRALELPSRLQGDFLAPASISPEIFIHAIQALANNSQETQGTNLPAGLRGAIAIRTRMVELGMLPDSEADDLILRRICSVARGIKSAVSRHEFLSEMIGGMFPTSKIVPIRSEPLRSFRFNSHPGKSPEAFRLMRWLMESNELDLSLHVFQSISRYGYVSSLTAIPFSYLKRLLEKALYSHPELAMELYQHLHMSGSDRSGELFRAVKAKAIAMGDERLAEYLLKSSDDQDRARQAARITSFIAGFARRRAAPGNVSKTLSLFDSIWVRWSSASIEPTVWAALSDQILRLGPVKLAQRPELRPQIYQLLCRLDQAVDLELAEQIKTKKNIIECLEVSQLIEPHLDHPVPADLDSPQPTPQPPPDRQLSDRQSKEPKSLVPADHLLSIRTFEDWIDECLREGKLDRAVEASERALEIETMVSGPTIGRLLNSLVDQLLLQLQHTNDHLPTNIDHLTVLKINQDWRALAWKVNPHLRGLDSEVVRAMDRLYKLIK
ncbi:hypothetical protein PtB15_8B595 [Puccinia triticina]|nr:hypothetical protein PtB15_8B595 [Puccinia triticina]